MRVLYLDCVSGISGDMFVGAMLDAGLDFSFLQKELYKLNLNGFKVRKRTVLRRSIRGTKFDVVVDDRKRTPRTLKDILTIIDKSRLNEGIKKLSRSIFVNIAKAESKVHKSNLNNTYFHEVGDLDSIIDVVGAAIAIEKLGIEKVYGSPLNLGRTAPATLNLLEGYKVSFSNLPYELVTPTGAAIFKTLVEKIEPLPIIDVARIGYGAGANKIDEMPNLLKAVIGQANPVRNFALNDGAKDISNGALYDRGKVIVIQTNIDDMKPVMYGYIIEKLLEAGALDVFMTPTYMKKTRIGILLTILVKGSLFDKVVDVIFKETATIGLRYYEAERLMLKRETKKIKTRYGTINFKISKINKSGYRLTPEYEDCKKLAKKLKLPLQEVYKEANLWKKGKGLKERSIL